MASLKTSRDLRAFWAQAWKRWWPRAFEVHGFAGPRRTPLLPPERREDRWDALFTPARVRDGGRVGLAAADPHVEPRFARVGIEPPSGRAFRPHAFAADEAAARLARTDGVLVWDPSAGRWRRERVGEPQRDVRPTLIGADLDALRCGFRIDWDPLIGLTSYARAAHELTHDFDALDEQYGARHSRDLEAEFDDIVWMDESALVQPSAWELWASDPAARARDRYRHLAALLLIFERQRRRNRSLAIAVAGILRRLLGEGVPDLAPRAPPPPDLEAAELVPLACQPVLSPQETRAGPARGADEEEPCPVGNHGGRAGEADRPGESPP